MHIKTEDCALIISISNILWNNNILLYIWRKKKRQMFIDSSKLLIRFFAWLSEKLFKLFFLPQIIKVAVLCYNMHVYNMSIYLNKKKKEKKLFSLPVSLPALFSVLLLWLTLVLFYIWTRLFFFGLMLKHWICKRSSAM